MIVPVTVSDTVISHAAKFRSHGRFPVASFVHPMTGAVLARSSQPASGLAGMKRSAQDEYLVKQTVNDPVIVDARCMSSAMANALRGWGTETPEHYGSTMNTIVYLNLANIHGTREAVNDLSKWQATVERLLVGARVVKDYILNGRSVLVHCSDGWDRTPQLTSLVELMLLKEIGSADSGDSSDGTSTVNTDKLLDIIAREWIIMGHRFTTRHAMFGNNLKDMNEQSPIFKQFIDAVRLLDIYDPDFLTRLVYESYDPKGPFFGDCDRDRL